MVSRQDWGARGTVPRDSSQKFRIGIHHTVSPNRTWTKSQEVLHMQQLERTHMSQGWTTVGYSFLVFPSGRVYVGRGWTGLPAAQAGENTGSWAIAFVMNGETRKPSLLARRQVRKMIKTMKGKGAKQLGGHREFDGQATVCPGDKVIPFVRKWRRDFGLLRP
jgi:hypothetical protein